MLSLAAWVAVAGAAACIPPDDPTEAVASAESLATQIPESVTVGTSTDLDAYEAAAGFALPPQKAMIEIVGIAIASNDHVYTWFIDGTVAQGYSKDLDLYAAPVAFSLPAGKTTGSIVGVGIAANDHVYTWYSDGTVSEGTSTNLGQFAAPHAYTLPGGETAADIVGIDVAANDHVYTWFRDGRMSIGTSIDLDHYQGLSTYAFAANQKATHVLDMAIAGNDCVYTWYQDLEAGLSWVALANAVDQPIVSSLRERRIAGLTVAVSKNGRMVMNRGYGYKNIDTQASRTQDDRSMIGSVSKELTAAAVLRYTEQSPAFTLDRKVYGNTGVLSSNDYLSAMILGQNRHRPVVGFGIASNDHVYAWYQSGQVSSGTSTNLTAHSGLVPYTLPGNKTPDDILAIAIASDDHVYAWYNDGTRSIGTSTNLGAIDPGQPFTSPYGLDHVLAIGIRKSDDHVHIWYDTGRMSVGTSTDFEKFSLTVPFTVPSPYTPWDVVDADFASSGKAYFRYYDNRVSNGTPTQADADAAPYVSSIPFTPISPDWLTWYGQMTVRHLLNYSAGFSGSGDQDGAALMFGVDLAQLTYAQVNQYMLATRGLLAAPGTLGSYSNHSIGLAGHVLSVASGKSYEAYVRQNILDPLGLDHVVPNGTVLDGRDALPTKVAEGDPDDPLDDYIVAETLAPAENNTGLAAGGWSATAGDLVRFMLATDGLPNHPDILSATSIHAIETPPFPATNPSFALVWDYTPGRLSKYGAIGGGIAYIAKFSPGFLVNGVDLGGITIALCANGGRWPADGTTLKVLGDTIATAAASFAIDATYDLY